MTDMQTRLARISELSSDKNTQTSAILGTADGRYVISAANTLTKGVKATATNTIRPGKVPWIEHAERNVIYKAARLGISTSGLHLYMRWFPCAECARAIAQSGISRLYCDDIPDQCEKYCFSEAEQILISAGVEIHPILEAEKERT